jgi:uncharacterized protein
MPFNYKSPGVYVEEVSGGARPIESAATAILAMVGLCRETVEVQDPEKGLISKPTPADPILITNWTQFTSTYGGLDQAVPGGYLHDAMFGYFLNGGTSAYVVGLPVPVIESVEPQTPLLTTGTEYLLSAAGQQTLRLTSAPLKPDEAVSVEVRPAEAGAPESTFNLAVRRGAGEERVIPNLTLARGRGARNVAEVLTRETDGLLTAELLEAPGTLAERMPAVGSTVTLVPVPPATPAAPAPVSAAAARNVTPALFKGDVVERTGIAGLESVEEITLLACPDIVAAYQWGAVSEEDVKSVQLAMLNHCEVMKDRFAIIDCPPGLNTQGVLKWRQETMNFDSKYGALYYPWIKGDGKLMPPSGHVAGVYARVDAERGVFKAPANEQLRGVIGLERVVSRNDQDNLNPVGINCIRTFPGRGILIWGARTLSSDGQWRYVPVRRLFCNIEESILQGTQWIVFEPNDQVLWRQIRRDITAYLTVQWRSGALFGATAEQAFFVKCDEETNPPELRDLGYCVVEVGLAPVKPAEFVVFRISQMRDGAGSTSE